MLNRRNFLITILSFLTNNTESNILPGDILLTRNAGGEEYNSSPGYYNHSAIVGPLNWVIESQRIPDAIICVPIWNFFDRYPEILVLRNDNQDIAKKTAQVATQYIGRPYAKYMSIRPLFLWKYSDNCTSFIKRIYNYVTGQVYKWIIPDDFIKTYWLKKVAEKKDYDNFISPQNYYMGMQKVWSNQPAKKCVD